MTGVGGVGGAIGGHVGASGRHTSSRAGMGHQQLQVASKLLQRENNSRS